MSGGVSTWMGDHVHGNTFCVHVVNIYFKYRCHKLAFHLL